MRPNVHTEYAYIYFYNHQRIQLETGVAQRERRAPGKMKVDTQKRVSTFL